MTRASHGVAQRALFADGRREGAEPEQRLVEALGDVAYRASDGHVEVAQGGVQAHLAVGRLGAAAEDERARDAELARGKLLVTRPRDDDAARRDAAPVLDDLGPLTSRMAVDEVRTTPAPMTASRPIAHALDDDGARTDEDAVLDDDGRRPRRLEHAADADTAGQMAVAPDLRARSDGRPGIDHRPGAHARADVDVARHDHAALLRETSRSGRRRRHDAHAGRVEAVLEGDLVVELEGPDLDRSIFRSAKKRRIACFTQAWSVHAPPGVGGRPRDAELAAIEREHGGKDGLRVRRERELGAIDVGCFDEPLKIAL